MARKFIRHHPVLIPAAGLTGIFLLACLAIYLRRPDALRHAQFWAEDGSFWYADAYNVGPWQPLLQAKNGYFQTISRLVADLSLLLPMRWAPLFFNICAITIQALPVVFLWSKRFRAQVPAILPRLVLSVLYLEVPNSMEVHANITNAHWHLAILAFMILIARPASNRIWSVFDYTVLILTALSGPFSIVLAPLALLYWAKRRHWQVLRTAAILAVGAVVQLASVILSSKAGRSSEQLAASWGNFTKIFGGQVIGSSLVGMYHLPLIYLHRWGALSFTVLGFLIISYVLIRAKLEVKLFILFTLIIFAASLASPMISVTEPQWEVLARQSAGTRYFFLPILGWYVALLWLASHRPRWIQAVGIGLLCVAPVGLWYDRQYTPYVQYNYKAQVEKFEALPNGERQIFLLNPIDIPMTLVRH